MDFVIETNGLTRFYGQTPAVEGLTLRVPRGGVFALLGRNGSGKTTTLRMLVGLLEPTRGSARVLGYDCRMLPPEARARIGYAPEGHPLYGWMRVRQLLDFQKATFRRWNRELVGIMLDHFRVDPGQQVKHLSRGQRAGVALALVLAPDPEVLILDDPSLGLDPVARRLLLEALLHVAHEHKTVLLSSHDLTEVERIADHVAILDQSVLRCACSVETLRHRVRKVRAYFPDVPATIPPIPGLVRAVRCDGHIEMTVANGGETLERQLDAMGATRIVEQQMSLEDIVLDYLSRQGNDVSLIQGLAGTR